MKKFLCVIFLLIFISSAFADDFRVGVLAQLNMTEEEYKNFVLEGRETVGFNFLSHENEDFRYYYSLLTMQLALNAGEIGEVDAVHAAGDPPDINVQRFIPVVGILVDRQRLV